jgi:predicted RNase H-like nuclease (RuvC/YqgF family)
MSQNGDDLYDDVMDVKPAANTDRHAHPDWHAHSGPLSLTDQVQMLQKRVTELERENEQLQRNMGTLYRTAKAELQRKDDQIHQLLNETKE